MPGQQLPTHLNPRWLGYLPECVAALTQEQGQRFFKEVFESAGRPEELEHTLEAWFRTMIFLSRPDFKKSLQEARENPGEPLTVKEIRMKILGDDELRKRFLDTPVPRDTINNPGQSDDVGES